MQLRKTAILATALACSLTATAFATTVIPSSTTSTTTTTSTSGTTYTTLTYSPYTTAGTTYSYNGTSYSPYYLNSDYYKTYTYPSYSYTYYPSYTYYSPTYTAPVNYSTYKNYKTYYAYYQPITSYYYSPYYNYGYYTGYYQGYSYQYPTNSPTVIADTDTPPEELLEFSPSKALPMQTRINVGGSESELASYIIDNTVVVKLRDVAAALNGTDCQFSVSWYESTHSLALQQDAYYTPVGTEAVSMDTASTWGYVTNANIMVNGVYSNLPAYDIEDSFYISIYDLSLISDFTFDVAEGFNGSVSYLIDTGDGMPDSMSAGLDK